MAPASFAVPLALIGVGAGVLGPSVTADVLRLVPAESSATASGVLATSQQLGAALGITLFGLLYFTELARHDVVRATSAALFACALALLAAAALARFVTLPAVRSPA
ncbi:hypothetical protein [Actinoplanes couchii]|uniref:hypothetical protein n=1 Tax=Actinoplanes couchii TaxID=403638 RepID=UPI001945ADF5|nr:hypothetical protein [Actinoplanes couchii]MDR6318645.1 MFS family permease [Actinoplanes couchii]